MSIKNKTSYFFILLIIIIWELTVIIIKIPNYLLPRPSEILLAFFTNISIILPNLSITFIESFLGFILGSSIGVFLAIIFTYSKTLEKGIFPYAIALKSVPVVAIAPLFIIWFGNGILPKVLISAIISFFPVVVNVVRGLNEVDEEAFDLFESLSATKAQVFFKLRLYYSLPFLFSALKMSSTLAVIGAIVSEFAGSDKGIGYYIIVSSHRLETTQMFLGIIISSLLGILYFYLIAFLEDIFTPWNKQKNDLIN